ncbi:protein-disulfide reductase DsbD [Methylophaga sp. OBS3]|uniref:protein-disulfide reductase DsbD n=1 Tax=Methylophaga sp. OBS3 TaxID=2991934 RepID=UPI00224FDBD3|nr:protein-disulfide reductase DsbD [Methylophaga sp. OBS3]MCX4189884.1 protein-disulfide reductase DsbD [Methylophaga sp. OBS3]
MRSLVIFFLILVSCNLHARESVLQQLGFGDGDEPLAVDDAFRFSASVKDPQNLHIGWQIAQGNYLYRNKIEARIIDNDRVTLKTLNLPQGTNKNDAYFGLTEVYFDDVLLTVPVNRPDSTQSITLEVHYQGCSETFNICYPPETKTTQLKLPAIAQGDPPITTPISEAPNPVTSINSQSSQDTIAAHLASENLPKILISFLGLGLLLAFTPCVFPMIPILSSIIVGEGESVTTRRAFMLSLVYVLAMSVTYTTAGVLTGLLGGNLQALLQNIWVIGAFSLVLVLLALSMFGFYELQLPHRLQHRLHQISHQQRGGKFIGVALMGLLSGLIVGPCLAPPLAGALLFISQHADPVLGGAALFAMSIGMGIPLLIIGSSAGSLMPRAGNWMETVKAVFGVLLIALAIWMLSRVIPASLTLALWAGLIVVSAVYMGALESLGIDATGWQKFWKGLGLLGLIFGTLLMIGAASGAQSIWQPLKHLKGVSTETSQETLSFTLINSPAELERALSNSQQPMMLDFYADWCTDCKTMEQTTFKDPTVLAMLKSFNLLKVDLTDNTADHQAILKQLKVFGPPTMVFFAAGGEEYANRRLVGHVSADEMQAHLAKLQAAQEN